MANGASRLFEVMKNTGESTNNMPSQVVSLTIKSVNPLILIRDDRLEIPAEFCILYKNLNINSFRIGDIVTAIVLNDGQQYFILSNDTAEEQGVNYEDLSNKPKINNVTLIGNKTSSDLSLDNYNNMQNKPQINGVELSGNKTSDDLLIVSKSELQQIVADLISNINGKVSKSGDTMTGILNFSNDQYFSAMHKIRKLNSINYSVDYGVGSIDNIATGAIEVHDGNGNTIARLDVVGANGRIRNTKNNTYLVEEQSSINFMNWHSVVLTRSDNNYVFIMLYGTNRLKVGTYSIQGQFKLVTYGTTNSTLTIPTSAIASISRRDWGFEVTVNRSGISGIASTQYNGIAVVSDGALVLKST